MKQKTFKQFSARDQKELTKMLEELQKLKPPKHNVGIDLKGEPVSENASVFYNYKFFLGHGKEFRITRIK